MGGHQLFDVAAAAPLAMDGCLVGKNQHLGNMAAIGTQKIKKWHVSPPVPSTHGRATHQCAHPPI
jgi:hypothetical protein